jgi:hypothetical protein
MPVTTNSGAQELVVKTAEITFASLVSGTDYNAVALPIGAVVDGGWINVTTVWNSATTDVLDVGDSASQNRYKNDQDIKGATGAFALVPTGYSTTASTRWVTIRWVGAGAAPTTGAATLTVRYWVKGRAAFSQD